MMSTVRRGCSGEDLAGSAVVTEVVAPPSFLGARAVAASVDAARGGCEEAPGAPKSGYVFDVASIVFKRAGGGRVTPPRCSTSSSVSSGSSMPLVEPTEPKEPTDPKELSEPIKYGSSGFEAADAEKDGGDIVRSLLSSDADDAQASSALFGGGCRGSC